MFSLGRELLFVNHSLLVKIHENAKLSYIPSNQVNLFVMAIAMFL